MDYTQALERIHSRKTMAHAPGLEVMRRLMERLGNPQSRLKFVHVVGTNGKGSVTTMLATILQHAGYKTGLTVSPYVVDFRERFQINGAMIPPEDLAQLVADIWPQMQAMSDAGEGEVGEFELVTAIALTWFAKENCDIVCLEAGLGGRFDATNIISAPLITCITRIGLDHTAILGDTLEQIAAEKCAVIKPGTTVVCYPEQPDAAMAVIRKACEQAAVPCILPQTEDVRYIASNLLQNRVEYGGYEAELPMKGRWQALHMAMAIEAALALWRAGWSIEDDAILQGLSEAKLPARMEILSLQPLVLLDGSHNPDGIDALASMIEKSGLPKMHAVIGMMRDKACTEMLRRLSDCFDVVYTVTPDNPRALPAQELADMAAPFFEKTVAGVSVAQALADAQQGIGRLKGLCICGSLYLAGEARKIFLADAKN